MKVLWTYVRSPYVIMPESVVEVVQKSLGEPAIVSIPSSESMIGEVRENQSSDLRSLVLLNTSRSHMLPFARAWIKSWSSPVRSLLPGL